MAAHFIRFENIAKFVRDHGDTLVAEGLVRRTETGMDLREDLLAVLSEMTYGEVRSVAEGVEDRGFSFDEVIAEVRRRESA